MTASAHHAEVHQDPNFGWDPWLNPATDPSRVTEEFLAMVDNGTVFFGADATRGSLSQLPPNLAMYASYVDNFGGFPELQALKGNSGAFLLSYTIVGRKALCADVQSGAMRPGDFGGWYDHTAQRDAEGRVWGYTSASQMQALINAAGSREFVKLSAHYGFGFHICGPHTCGFPQADWTQCFDHGANNENIDRLMGLYLPTAPHAPRFATGVANFSGQIVFDTGGWSIEGERGPGIVWGTENVRWSAEIQVDGSNGSWDIQGLPYNAPIPTQGDGPLSNPATGYARFTGSVNFDTGQWDIHGISGFPTWGAQEKWSAVIKIDNRFGNWGIFGAPYNAPPMGA